MHGIEEIEEFINKWLTLEISLSTESGIPFSVISTPVVL